MQGSPRNRIVTIALSAVVLLVGGALGWVLWQSGQNAVPRGQALYEKNCAVCHGLTGNGQGEAAYLLQPTPRNFRAGKFRLVSSQGLQPTREDLFRTIGYGMPGTAMPSWAHLPESDRWELADYVLKLNRDGLYDKGLALRYSPAEARKYAAEMAEAGAPVAIHSEPPLTKPGLEEGRAYFLKACATCHGPKGEGRRDRTWRTAEGYPTWSRNFREGVFKGGREGKQLYLRFFTGLPGTPMPSGQLSPEQVWRVVHYVQSLSDPTAQERAETRATEIVAKRVAKIPDGPEDAIWQTAAPAQISLMPLWWRAGYISAVQVRAVHDGVRLAFRLEWQDPTGNWEAIHQTSFPDGAAVQLAASPNPPLFAMGASGEVVNLWHWKALWEEDAMRFQDVGQAFPGMAADAYFGEKKGWRSEPLEDTTFRTAAGVHNSVAASQRSSSVEDANAGGVGTFTVQAAQKQSVQGISRWKDGRWALQLSREMRAPDREDVPLRPGARVSTAFAIWDGQGGDRNGQKSVSIWNTLVLE